MRLFYIFSFNGRSTASVSLMLSAFLFAKKRNFGTRSHIFDQVRRWHCATFLSKKFFFEKESITVQKQAILLLVVIESGTRKLRKVVESRTKFLFDVKRVLDSTTFLNFHVLDSTTSSKIACVIRVFVSFFHSSKNLFFQCQK